MHSGSSSGAEVQLALHKTQHESPFPVHIHFASLLLFIYPLNSSHHISSHRLASRSVFPEIPFPFSSYFGWASRLNIFSPSSSIHYVFASVYDFYDLA